MYTIQRATARFLLVCFSLLAFGCSGNRAATSQSNLPPIDDTQSRTSRSAPASGKKIVTKKNMVMLAGAAALYYMYKKRQKASEATGPDSQYYLSKNGRVYYRDSSGRAHWVTAPREGIMVPVNEAAGYQQFQGYNNSASGRDLVGL